MLTDEAGKDLGGGEKNGCMLQPQRGMTANLYRHDKKNKNGIPNSITVAVGCSSASAVQRVLPSSHTAGREEAVVAVWRSLLSWWRRRGPCGLSCNDDS